MTKKFRNQINPCAKVLSDIARICFLINEETEFDAHFEWAGHVNNIDVYITPKKSGRAHAVMKFEEYINIPKSSDFYADEFRTDTYPAAKKFAIELQRFYEMHMGG